MPAPWGCHPPPPPCDVIWPSTPFKKNVGPAPITSHPPAPPPPRSPGCDGNVAPRGAGSATSRLAESFKFLTQILHVRSCIRSGQKSFPPTHPHLQPGGHSDELSDSWGSAAPHADPPETSYGGLRGVWAAAAPEESERSSEYQTNKQTNSQTQTHTQTNKRTHKQTNTHTTNKQTNAHTKTRHTTKPSGPLPPKRPGTSTSHAGLRQILRFSNPRRPLIGFSPN